MRLALLTLALALAGCDRSEAAPHAAASASSAVAAPAPVAKPKPSREQPTRYPLDRTHSPIDARVAAELAAIAARNPRLASDSFAKVGDSMTASGDFMRCFADDKRSELGAHSELGLALARFRASAKRPFGRESEAARIGWSAWQPLSGAPSPLERELSATSPRFALVQYGTNDIEIAKLHFFADKLFDLVDWLSARGVIPILFTIPPRRDRTEAAVWVPRYNAVIRGIAQARRIPLVDYHREMLELPGAGLGKDGIHPSTHHGPLGRNACDFSSVGLRHGYNLRNLLALAALDRSARALAGEVLDSSAVVADPRRVTELPFIDSVRFAGSRQQSYRIELERAVSLRALGFDRGGEVELVLSSGAATKTGKQSIETRLSPGAHTLELRRHAEGVETLLVLLAD